MVRLYSDARMGNIPRTTVTQLQLRTEITKRLKYYVGRQSDSSNCCCGYDQGK